MTPTYSEIEEKTEYLYPNRGGNQKKISFLVDLIRDTYFKKHNIDNRSSTLHNSLCTDFNSFHITFPLSEDTLKVNEVLDDLNNNPLLYLACNIVTSSTGIHVLHVNSNMH